MVRRRTGVHSMPVELISRAFTQLGLADLVLASHVCHIWRLLALDDTLYWRHFMIRDVSEQTMDFVAHRLACGRNRPKITIDIDYRQQHWRVESRLLPLLASALPRARVLVVRIESIYRMQTEKVLSGEADCLEIFQLLYGSDPLPDLFLDLTLTADIFAGKPGKLKQVRLHNIIIGRKPIPAFCNVEELWWLHGLSTLQADFPCYLFDFFPKTRRLRMSGGAIYFNNAPLPKHVISSMSNLEWLDITFQEASLVSCFRHLPLDDVPEVVLCGAEFDSVYTALEPLRSYFDIALTRTYSKEFYITIKGQSHLIRHFSETRAFYEKYEAGSILVNCLFEDEAFFAQAASLQIQTSLWSLLRPWLPALPHLPKLILEIDDDRVSLPDDALPCPGLSTLVLQAQGDFTRVQADDLLAFADRITTERIALELRRVLIDGPHELLAARFETVEYSTQRYLIVRVP